MGIKKKKKKKIEGGGYSPDFGYPSVPKFLECISWGFLIKIRLSLILSHFIILILAVFV